MADTHQLGGCLPQTGHRVAQRAGLEPAHIAQVTPLWARHGHCLWRVATRRRRYVLKWFPPGDAGASETAAYRLLQGLGVPTLTVHAWAEDALLLEDLATSAQWRLATEEDVADPAVGRAVARWYRIFHRQGAELLAGDREVPQFLGREIDRLDAGSLRAAGRRLGLEEQPGWHLAIARIDELKAVVRALPETLNYNDFFWSNLALSRAPQAEPQAIVFDYHLLGIGPSFGDCRNVAASLRGGAVPAFWQEYGPPDRREEILDRPTSTLVALVTATQRDRFPRWAQSSLERARDGRLERDLRTALVMGVGL